MVEKILNGNFSTSAGGNDNDPTSWVVTENAETQVAGKNPWFERLTFNRGNSAPEGSVEQTVSVEIGKIVNFSVEFYEHGHGGDPSVLIEIIDGDGSTIFSQTATNPAGETITHKFTTLTDSYTVRFIDTSTGNLGSHDAHIDNVSFDVVCFSRGTQIGTLDGMVPIETIEPGTFIRTADHGFQPLNWIGSKKLDIIDLMNAPRLLPILIPAGALGPGVPFAHLIVSPQHRILLRSKVVQRLFKCDEVLVAAKKLVGHGGIRIMRNVSEVEYFHLLFDHHEVVFANGAEAESLFLGPVALATLGPAAVLEIQALFPDIDLTPDNPKPARSIAKGRKLHNLMNRHVLNSKMLTAPLQEAKV